MREGEDLTMVMGAFMVHRPWSAVAFALMVRGLWSVVDSDVMVHRPWSVVVSAFP